MARLDILRIPLYIRDMDDGGWAISSEKLSESKVFLYVR